jgi:HK97 family phage prohead protease
MKHGSFKRTLEERGLPPIVYSHDWTEPPMGQSLDAQETRGGLDVLYQLFVRDGEDHPTARKADAALRGGALKEGSFAFEVMKSREVEEEGKAIRDVQDADLFEVGPTLVGMNDGTRGHLQAASLLASVDLRATFAEMLKNDSEMFEQLSKSIALDLMGLTNRRGAERHLDDTKSITKETQDEPQAKSEDDEELAARIARFAQLSTARPR